MMPRQLLLLRHAKSDWASGGTSDFARPLSARGRKDAKAMGRWLGAQGWRPDRILASPALRARDTVERVCRAADIPESTIVWEAAIYDASLAALLRLLTSDAANQPRVMVVGHNPGLEQLLLHLAGETVARPPDGKILPTATLACLAMPEEWRDLPPVPPPSSP